MENITGQGSASSDAPQSSVAITEARDPVSVAVKPIESAEDEVDLFDCFSDTFDDVDWDTFDRTAGIIHHESTINVHAAAVDPTEGHATRAAGLEAAHDEDESSTYSFEELDDTVFRELDAIEARFSEDPAAFRLSGSSSHNANKMTVTTRRSPEVASSSQAIPSSSQQMPSTPPRKSPEIRHSTEPRTPRRVSSSLPASLPPPSQESKHEPHEAVTPNTSPRKRQHFSPFSPSKKGRLDSPEPSVERNSKVPPPPFPLPTDKGKGKGKEKSGDGNREELRHVLDGYEDEMSCPICCDLFVAAHLVNPCGHSVCGSCGNDWISRQSPDERPTCPICRAKMIRTAPLIPNFSLDNTVARHVQALQENGVAGWGPGGAKLADWNRRKEEWKQAPRIDPPKKSKRKSKRRAQQPAQ